MQLLFDISTFYEFSKASSIHYIHMKKNEKTVIQSKIRAYQQRVNLLTSRQSLFAQM